MLFGSELRWGRFADRIPQDLYVVAVGVPEVEGAATVSVVSRAVVDDDATIAQLLGELIDFFLCADPKAEMVERLQRLGAAAKSVHLFLRDLDQGEIIVAALEEGDFALASPDRLHPEHFCVKLLRDIQVAHSERQMPHPTQPQRTRSHTVSHQTGAGPPVSVPAAVLEETENPTISSPPSTPITLPVIQ